MERVDVFEAMGIVGGLLVIASFVAYAFTSLSALIATFIIGAVMLAVGYVMIYRLHKGVSSGQDSDTAPDASAEPFVLDLEGSYGGDSDPATIEELDRCPRSIPT